MHYSFLPKYPSKYQTAKLWQIMKATLTPHRSNLSGNDLEVVRYSMHPSFHQLPCHTRYQAMTMGAVKHNEVHVFDK